jgi:hypothetical protein
MPRGAPVHFPQSNALQALQRIVSLHKLLRPLAPTRISLAESYCYRGIKRVISIEKHLLLSVSVPGSILSPVAKARAVVRRFLPPAAALPQFLPGALDPISASETSRNAVWIVFS